MPGRLTIEFYLKTEFGDEFTQRSTVGVCDTAHSDICVLGEQFNSFLKQCGYPRENDYMLMEDLSERELDLLTDYLQELRKGACE